jgi:hypothetical protein
MPNFNPLRSFKFCKKAKDDAKKQEARRSSPKVASVTAFNATTAQLSTTTYKAGPSSKQTYSDPSLFAPAITDIVDEPATLENPPSTSEDNGPAYDVDDFDFPGDPAEVDVDEESRAQTRYQVRHYPYHPQLEFQP